MHTYIHMCVYMHIYTCTQIHAHANTQIYIHIDLQHLNASEILGNSKCSKRAKLYCRLCMRVARCLFTPICRSLMRYFLAICSSSSRRSIRGKNGPSHLFHAGWHSVGGARSEPPFAGLYSQVCSAARALSRYFAMVPSCMCSFMSTIVCL